MSEGYQPKPGGIPNDQLKPPRGGSSVEKPFEKVIIRKNEYLTVPEGWHAVPLHVVTQAKYFHYVEVDGQKAMLGFQTYEELQAHLGQSDSPTIREASE